MISEKPRYLSFIDIADKVSRRLPNYSSKFSKRTFTQRQLMTLYILKQKSKLSYEEFVDDFSTRDSAISDLQLKKVPAASTLKMFVRRVDTKIFEEMIADCIQLTRKINLETAVDATGFQLEDGSYSYLKRLGLATKKRKNMKLGGCVETNKHLFLSVKIRKKNRHDNIDYKPLMKKAKKNTKKMIVVSVGDKAYDSEDNHEFAEKNGFEHIAPLRSKTKQYHRIKGRHRKKLFRKFPKKRYHRRSIIENMFFCVKRLCGKAVRAKKWMMQKKEMLAKVLAYNIHRLVQLTRI
ncbi:MAG: transposase [Elusimicrobiota bacterium]